MRISDWSSDVCSSDLVSFNNPFGACPACDGLGTTMYFDPDLVIPNPTLSLRGGAVGPWASRSSQYYVQTLNSLAGPFGVSMDPPWQGLPAAVREAILRGTGDQPVTMAFVAGRLPYHTNSTFARVIPPQPPPRERPN